MSEQQTELTKPRSVKFNFIMNLIVSCSSVIFPLITFPYVTRMLLAANYGRAIWAESVVTYFALFSLLGIGTYGIRLVARVRDDRKELSKEVSEVMTILIAMAIIVYAVFAICVFTIPRFEQERTLLLIYSATLITGAFGISWFFAGLENYSFIAVMTVLARCISLVCIFLFIHNPDDYLVFAIIMVASNSVCYIIYFIYAFKFADIRIPVAPNLKRHVKPLMVFFLIALSSSIYLNLDTVMLGFMDTNTAVGYYTAAVKIKTVLVAVITALGAVVLPRASYLLEQGEKEQFRDLNVKVAQFAQLTAIPLCCFFIAFAHPTILILAGADFMGAVMPLRIIMPAIVFIALSQVLGMEIMVPMGQEKLVALSTLIAAVIDLALNLVLIPLWSASGAAFSTTLAEIGVFIVQMVLLRNFLKGCHMFKGLWKILIACIASFVLPALLCWWAPMGEIACFLVNIVLYFGSYLGLLLVLRVPLARELLQDIAGIKNRLLHKEEDLPTSTGAD